MTTDQIKCPKCGSTQITVQKKGFSIGQALVGGVIGGFIGSSNVNITCLNCGKRFRPGDSRRAEAAAQVREQAKAEERRKREAMTKEQREAQDNKDVASLAGFIFFVISEIALFYFWRFLLPIFIAVTIGMIIYRMIKKRKMRNEGKELSSDLAISGVALYSLVATILIFLFFKGFLYITHNDTSWLMHPLSAIGF